MRRIGVLTAFLFASACAPSPQAQPEGARTGSRAAPARQVPDEPAAPADTSTPARIARLEREARSLAHAEGCGAGQCRTAPVGSRPCGGPREYLVYCAATTDSAALFAKLAELARTEAAFNAAQGLASTCEFRTPPSVRVVAGRCTAGPSNELPVQ